MGRAGPGQAPSAAGSLSTTPAAAARSQAARSPRRRSLLKSISVSLPPSGWRTFSSKQHLHPDRPRCGFASPPLPCNVLAGSEEGTGREASTSACVPSAGIHRNRNLPRSSAAAATCWGGGCLGESSCIAAEVSSAPGQGDKRPQALRRQEQNPPEQQKTSAFCHAGAPPALAKAQSGFLLRLQRETVRLENPSASDLHGFQLCSGSVLEAQPALPQALGPRCTRRSKRKDWAQQFPRPSRALPCERHSKESRLPSARSPLGNASQAEREKSSLLLFRLPFPSTFARE